MEQLAFPKYENYKPSGIEWVGEIPAHWGTQKGKWLFKKVERPVRPEDKIVTAFRDGTVTLRSNRRTEGFTNAIQEHGYQGIRKGDLVIHAMDAFAGAIGVSDSEGKATPVYAACVGRGEFKTNNQYFAYLLRFISKAGYILALAKGIRERSTDFRFNDFGKLLLPLPPKAEQDRIANFLDRKTAEIDEAIAKKLRLIELLKEQKAILINQAVTKGLNPDAPMRDSGVEWIGDIPSHWLIRKLKYFTEVQSGITLGKLYGGNNLSSYPYLRVANVQAGYFELAEIAELRLPRQIANQYLVRKGDILITEGGDIDKLGRGTVWKGEIGNCLHQNHIFAVRVNQRLVSEYFVSIALGADYGRRYFTHTANKTTNLASTNKAKLGNFPVAIPPINEQQKILEYCEVIDTEYDAVINTVLREVASLNEYKQVVAADAVTGKIKL